MNNPGVIFIDIDGTILYQCDLKEWDPYNIGGFAPSSLAPNATAEEIAEWKKELSLKIIPIPGVKDKLIKWHVQGYKIILTTARPESLRPITIKTLEYFGIIYNELIMNLPQGPRYLINNIDDDEEHPRAIAYNVLTNKGLDSVDI